MIRRYDIPALIDVIFREEQKGNKRGKKGKKNSYVSRAKPSSLLPFFFF